METGISGLAPTLNMKFNRIYEEWKPTFSFDAQSVPFVFNRIYEEWKPTFSFDTQSVPFVFNRIYEEWKHVFRSIVGSEAN